MAPIPRTNDDMLDGSLHDLDKLLTRLDRNILSDDADPQLQHSVYQRRKTGANVEYARTLLLRLEHDASIVKVQPRRQALNADLQSKRDLIKRLNRRLIELDQIDDSDTAGSEEEYDGPAGGTRAAGQFGPARKDTSAGIEIDQNKPPIASAPAEPTLRSRGAAPPSSSQPTDSATTTSSLFAGRKSSPSRSNLQNREQILDQDTKTQDAISAALLTLTQTLKDSSIQLGAAIEGGKGTVDRAAAGLDKNALGLEAAERRMGTLRKMTEGQGWYGRLKLYALIAALWIAAFLLVFVGPKLRF